MKLRPLAFVVALTGSGCAAALPAPEPAVHPRRAPAVTRTEADARARVAEARARCPGTIRRSLGLDLGGDPRLDAVRFELRPSSDAPALGLPATSPGGFHRIELDHGTEHVITVFLDRAEARPDKIEAFVCHEMIHATLAIALGPRTTEVPRWFHEGLAVYGSGQLGDKLSSLVATRGPAPPGFPDGLATHGPGLEDLVEDGLAISYVAHYRGADAVRELTARVIAGESAEQAVRAVTGFDPITFGERVTDFIRVRLRSVRPRS